MWWNAQNDKGARCHDRRHVVSDCNEAGKRGRKVFGVRGGHHDRAARRRSAGGGESTHDGAPDPTASTDLKLELLKLKYLSTDKTPRKAGRGWIKCMRTAGGIDRGAAGVAFLPCTTVVLEKVRLSSTTC